MNSLALAQALAPVLLWRVQTTPSMLRAPALPNYQVSWVVSTEPQAPLHRCCPDSLALN